MPIATKNGSIIVKDGSIAENCGCCGCDSRSLCQILRQSQVSVSVSLSNYETQDDVIELSPAGYGVSDNAQNTWGNVNPEYDFTAIRLQAKEAAKASTSVTAYRRENHATAWDLSLMFANFEPVDPTTLCAQYSYADQDTQIRLDLAVVPATTADTSQLPGFPACALRANLGVTRRRYYDGGPLGETNILSANGFSDDLTVVDNQENYYTFTGTFTTSRPAAVAAVGASIGSSSAYLGNSSSWLRPSPEVSSSGWGVLDTAMLYPFNPNWILNPVAVASTAGSATISLPPRTTGSYYTRKWRQVSGGFLSNWQILAPEQPASTAFRFTGTPSGLHYSGAFSDFSGSASVTITHGAIQ